MASQHFCYRNLFAKWAQGHQDLCSVIVIQVIHAIPLYRGLDGSLTVAVIHDEYSKGLGEAEQQYRLHLYGENSIIVKVKSYFKLFIEEVSHLDHENNSIGNDFRC